MRKYRGMLRKKIVLKPVLRKPVENPVNEQAKEQMESFEAEYQKFIEQLKAKKNEKTPESEDSQLSQSNEQ